MVISGGSAGIFGIFIVAGEPWCEKIGVYVKFRKFSRVLVEFWRS
jgi:hypothetical protein